MLKRVLRARVLRVVAGRLFAWHLRFVRATSSIVFESPQRRAEADAQLPFIIATWHGEHFVLPCARPQHWRSTVLVSLHRDGEINAASSEALGIETIRGSGSQGKQRLDKRGAAAFRDMLRALDDGSCIVMTADVPKVSRVAGPGVVRLAQFSGRVIYPVAVASRWRLVAKRSWDRSAVPLPFSRIGVVIGDAIHVARDADPAALETARLAVERALNVALAKAYAIADG